VDRSSSRGAVGGSKRFLLHSGMAVVQAWPPLVVRQEVRHPWKFNSSEIGPVATLGSTTGDSRVKYQPTSIVTVGFFVVVNIAWRSQWSHDMLGVHRPTTVAALLLATERARRAIDVTWGSQRYWHSLTCSDFAGRRRLLLN